MFNLFVPFLSAFFHKKNLVLLNLFNKYVISTSDQFLSKDSQCMSCYELITGSVNICLYECGSVLAPSVCSVSLYVCVISNQGASKKDNVSGLSKLDVLLHKTLRKVLLVLRYQCST